MPKDLGSIYTGHAGRMVSALCVEWGGKPNPPISDDRDHSILLFGKLTLYYPTKQQSALFF